MNQNLFMSGGHVIKFDQPYSKVDCLCGTVLETPIPQRIH